MIKNKKMIINFSIFIILGLCLVGYAETKLKTKWIVCIDPGHQAVANPTQEPIGPGSDKTKPCVSSGTGGKLSGREHQVVLDVGLRLKALLETQGVQVVMTRTTSDVDICNSARAQIANDAHADLFIRLHCNAGATTERGCFMLYPARITGWTDDIDTQSLAAARIIEPIYEKTTGLPAYSGGYSERADLSGFNWADVPSVLPEMLFQTNEIDDALAAKEDFRQTMAKGLADGIIEYLKQYAPLTSKTGSNMTLH